MIAALFGACLQVEVEFEDSMILDRLYREAVPLYRRALDIARRATAEPSGHKTVRESFRNRFSGDGRHKREVYDALKRALSMPRSKDGISQVRRSGPKISNWKLPQRHLPRISSGDADASFAIDELLHV
jgi:hypothetical protein